MAISAGDFRTGLTLIIDGDPCQVLDFQHVKPGKGAAILKTKMRNLKTGAIQEKNFNASTKFDQANISKKAAQFSMKQTILFTSWIWKHMIHMNYLKNKLVIINTLLLKELKFI